MHQAIFLSIYTYAELKKSVNAFFRH